MNCEIDFIFKGGTALLLIQQENLQRLSIDIDIIIPNPFDELGDKLDEIAQKQGFVRFEGQNRNGILKFQKDISSFSITRLIPPEIKKNPFYWIFFLRKILIKKLFKHL